MSNNPSHNTVPKGWPWLTTTVSIVLCLFATPTKAQGPNSIDTDRPSQSISTSIVGKGLVQIETGWYRAKEKTVLDTEISDSVFPEILIRIGLARRIEVRTGSTGRMVSEYKAPTFTQHEEKGGDLYLGVKWLFSEQKNMLPNMAVHFGATLPVGATRSASEDTGPQIGLLFQHEFNSSLTLGCNLVADWYNIVVVGGDRDHRIEYLYSICLDVIPASWVTTFVEYYLREPRQDRDPDSRNLALGCKLRIYNNLQIDVAYGLKRGSWADGDFFRVGMSVRIPR